MLFRSNVARKAADDAFKVEMDKFQLAREAWDEQNGDLIAEINDQFKKDINKARTDFRSAFLSAKTTEAKAAARNALNAATLAATTARQVAIEALGEPPTPPTRPVLAPRPIEPLKPLDPAAQKSNKRIMPSQPDPRLINPPRDDSRGKSNPKDRQQPPPPPGSNGNSNPSA